MGNGINKAPLSIPIIKEHPLQLGQKIIRQSNIILFTAF